MEGNHSSVMGGSTAARRARCPGSYALEQTVPPGKTSVHAERGTALHEAMEHYLLVIEPDGGDVEELVGLKFNGVEITPHLLEVKIKPALAAFQAIIDHMGGHLDFMVEVKASLDAVIPGAFGTIDILGKGGGRLLVLDWKFGDGVKVSPKENYQGGFYANCAVYDESEDIRSLVGKGPHNITIAIVQPREGHPDEPDYEIWETTSEWTETLLDELTEAYGQGQRPDAPLSTGEHCRFCPAKPVCPLQQRDMTEIVDAPAPSAMSPAELGEWLVAADKAERFIKAVREYAHNQLSRGVKVPGFKLVPKRGTRRYNDPAAAEAALRELSGVKVGDIMESKLISPAKLEKVLSKKRFDDFAETHVSMVSSGTTLARDTDARPDVSDPLTLLAQETAKT